MKKIIKSLSFVLLCAFFVFAVVSCGTYSVKFVHEDGTLISELELKKGEMPSCEAPVKAADNGYTYSFKEWEPAIAEVTDDAVYVAKFNKTAKEFAVTLNADGGSCDALAKYTYAVGATLPVPTKTGYGFEGWFANAEFTGSAVTKIGVSEYGAKEFFAKWAINKYTVTFDANGGELVVGEKEVTSMSVDYGTAASQLAQLVPTLEGYRFVKWVKVVDEAEVEIEAEELLVADTVVKAVWEAKQYNLTFEGVNEPMVVTFDAEIGTLPALPEKAGYSYKWIFQDEELTAALVWCYDEDMSVALEETANTDTAYQVKHSVEQLDGTFVLKDTENKTGTTDTDTAAEAMNLAGYTAQAFAQKKIAGDGSAVVEIQYKLNQYVVCINDGEFKEFRVVKYTEPVELPDLPAYTKKNAYDAIRWELDGKKVQSGFAFNVAHDAEIIIAQDVAFSFESSNEGFTVDQGSQTNWSTNSWNSCAWAYGGSRVMCFYNGSRGLFTLNADSKFVSDGTYSIKHHMIANWFGFRFGNKGSSGYTIQCLDYLQAAFAMENVEYVVLDIYCNHFGGDWILSTASGDYGKVKGAEIARFNCEKNAWSEIKITKAMYDAMRAKSGTDCTSKDPNLANVDNCGLYFLINDNATYDEGYSYTMYNGTTETRSIEIYLDNFRVEKKVVAGECEHELSKVEADAEAGTKEYYECSKCHKMFSSLDATVEYGAEDIYAHKITKHEAKAADCSHDGNTEYYSCSCGKFYSDAEATQEIAKKSWVIAALGHELSHIAAKDPTTKLDGCKEHYHCSKCGNDFADNKGETQILDAAIAATGCKLNEPTKGIENTISGLTLAAGVGKQFSIDINILDVGNVRLVLKDKFQVSGSWTEKSLTPAFYITKAADGTVTTDKGNIVKMSGAEGDAGWYTLYLGYQELTGDGFAAASNVYMLYYYAASTAKMLVDSSSAKWNDTFVNAHQHPVTLSGSPDFSSLTDPAINSTANRISKQINANTCQAVTFDVKLSNGGSATFSLRDANNNWATLCANIVISRSAEGVYSCNQGYIVAANDGWASIVLNQVSYHGDGWNQADYVSGAKQRMISLVSVRNITGTLNVDWSTLRECAPVYDGHQNVKKLDGAAAAGTQDTRFGWIHNSNYFTHPLQCDDANFKLAIDMKLSVGASFKFGAKYWNGATQEYTIMSTAVVKNEGGTVTCANANVQVIAGQDGWVTLVINKACLTGDGWNSVDVHYFNQLVCRNIVGDVYIDFYSIRTL